MVWDGILIALTRPACCVSWVLGFLSTAIGLGISQSRRRIRFGVYTEGVEIIETGEVSGLFLPRNGNDRESVFW